jgi:cytochrome c oxidase cbb3-type subunit III
MSFCRYLIAAACAAVFCHAADPPPKEAVDRGQKLFVQSCGFCHGNDATGSRAPDLIRSASVNHDENGNAIGPIIRSGRPDKGMPGFPLSDAQIGDIAAFLQSRVLAALNSNSVGGDYPLEKLLTGNSAAGKIFFEGAGGCTHCHSVTRDLEGIGGKYPPIVLQSRILYPGGARSTVTVTPASGKQITGLLVQIDEFNVALRDDSGWYHSWPRHDVQAKVNDPLDGHRKLLYVYTDANVHDLFAYLEGLK